MTSVLRQGRRRSRHRHNKASWLPQCVDPNAALDGAFTQGHVVSLCPLEDYRWGNEASTTL